MFQLIKLTVFHAARFAGLFALCRYLYRHKVRILCYHGFTLKDEHRFVPGLFIETAVFQQRMQYLKDKGYQVLKLEDAYAQIENQAITADTVVLTIDDGFYSSLIIAAPILKRFEFPATLYLTSYYFDETCPIFTLAVDYMFWTTTSQAVNFSKLAIPGLEDDKTTDIASGKGSRACELIKNFGQSLPSNEERTRLMESLARLLNFDYGHLEESRLLNLINRDELAVMLQHGIDIQLHSHRHRFPLDSDKAGREITDNRAAVEPYLKQAMSHFCYPSGEWDKLHWPVLENHNVRTATTCESGLVDADTPRFAMNRILDSARISQIEFEAEVSGFNELIRQVRRRA